MKVIIVKISTNVMGDLFWSYGDEHDAMVIEYGDRIFEAAYNGESEVTLD